jgi:hypothetical protein
MRRSRSFSAESPAKPRQRTDSTAAVIVAKAETQSIPIVFRIGGDPVAAGIVPNLDRPGGNITGITTLGIDLEQSGCKSCLQLLLLCRLLRQLPDGGCLHLVGGSRLAPALLRPTAMTAVSRDLLHLDLDQRRVYCQRIARPAQRISRRLEQASALAGGRRAKVLALSSPCGSCWASASRLVRKCEGKVRSQHLR